LPELAHIKPPAVLLLPLQTVIRENKIEQ